MQNPDLWYRIEAYDFPKGFEEKLGTHFGGWARIARTLRDEYRRFVYLAMIAPEEVTPSEQIDAVWHLHLTYTRDYWEHFCANVLHHDFHHDPCDGPESMPRYRDQYAKTLVLYEKEFGELPPEKVWPTGKYWKNVVKGGAVATIGSAVGLWAIYLGGSGPKFLALLALLFLVAGGTYAFWSFPYEKRSANGSGCGGSSGCGGGGCGG